jgi:predicted metal-dependent hydrolase
MRRVAYGSEAIEYTFKERKALKSHYITVDADSGVILKGKKIDAEKADEVIKKKAKWIVEKLQLVETPKETIIVTGSRLPYLGKMYYVQIKADPHCSTPHVTFNHSVFRIYVAPKVAHSDILAALGEFYKSKAIEKITPRVIKIAIDKKFEYKQLMFRTMSKRWGSCTADNKIILNPNAIKLPYQLIDYLIIHELTHTKVKNHSKRFWAELSRHAPNWKELDSRINDMKF